jgi:hypothetical protein
MLFWNPEYRGVTREQLVVLEYPNGRTHMCTVRTSQELGMGAQFDMFGRSWRVSRVHRPSSRRHGEQSYLVCVTIGEPSGRADQTLRSG